jgi:putative oxidoreductase
VKRHLDLLLLLPRAGGGLLAAFGVMKLLDLEGTRDFFASLSLPMPMVSAVMAGLTETVGGLCLAVGLYARVAALPVLVTMIVAYASAHRAELLFTSKPFPFMVCAAIVLALGAGRYSVDGWRAQRKKS